MNPAPTLTGWLQLLGLLGGEVVVVVTLAALLQRSTKSALWRRTIWQVCTLGLLALVACELSGLSRGMIGWATAKKETKSPISFQVSTENRPATMLAEPGFDESAESPVAVPISFSKPMPQPNFTWWPGMIWLLGAVLVSGWTALARLWFVLRGRRRRVVNDGPWSAHVQSLARRLRIRRRIRLTESSNLSGPIAFGIFRPAISLPEGFRKRFTVPQQDAMLFHELAHLAAHDPVWYWLADTVTALLWWHPLAWWFRRQLHAASEAAADEASLLIENGPEVLAECLVELGRRLTQPQSSGWLGIEGSGFRSGLGRRVKRLVALRGQPWKPMRRTSAWLAKTFGPLALIALVLAGTAWTQPHQARYRTLSQAFRQSIFGLALFAVLPDEPDNKAVVASQNAVSDLLLQAKAHWETNNLMEAEAKVNEALKLDPKNEAAKKYLSLVQKLRDLDSGDQVSSFIIRNSKSPAEAESMLKEVLKINPENSMAKYQLSLLQLLPLLSFTNQENGLSRQQPAVTNEPPAKDILLHPTNPPKEVLPGASGTNSATKRMQSNDVLLYPTIPPKSVIAAASETDSASKSSSTGRDGGREAVARKLDSIVLDEMVFKGEPLTEPPPLHTRWFKIDLDAFLQKFQSEIHQDRGSGSLATLTLQQRINALAREYFTAAAVDFGPLPSSRPGAAAGSGNGKSLFFNDRTGMLMVRATLRDLDIIDYAISALKLQPQPGSEKQFQTKDLDPALFLKEILLGASGTNSASKSSSTGSDRGREAVARKLDSIAPKDPPEPATLHNRWFRIDPNTLSGNLRTKLGTNASQASVTNGAETVYLDLRRYITSLGIDLSPPKAMFFKDRSGIVMFRATQQDLEIIDKAVQSLNTAPPQFNIDVKVAEITEEDSKALGFEWLSDSAWLDKGTNSLFHSFSESIMTYSAILSSNASQRPLAIVTDPQFHVVIRALEQRPGVDLLSAPKITTLSGRRAQLKCVDVRDIAVEYDYFTNKNGRSTRVGSNVLTRPFEMGLKADVLPQIAADGETVQIMLTCSIKEFLGYGESASLGAQPAPCFRHRLVNGTASLYDGQTLMFYCGSITNHQNSAAKVKVLGDPSQTGRFYLGESSKAAKRSLLILVTPRLIDPAGNPVHTDEDLRKFFHKIPPQQSKR